MQILLFSFKKAAMWLGCICIVLGSLCLYLKGENENKMLEYMKQKYKESFTELETYGGQFGKDYSMLRIKGDKFKADGILVRKAGKDGQYLYQDNYLAYLLREQIEQRMKELAEPVFGACKVFYKIPEIVFPAEFSADMELENFLKHSWSMIRIYLYIKDDSLKKNDQMEKFCMLLKEKEYLAGGVISWSLNENYYHKITRVNFIRAAYAGYQYRAEVIFSIKGKNAQACLKWKE